MSTPSIVSRLWLQAGYRMKIFLIITNVLAALRVIKSLYKNPVTGMRKKSEYEQNIALREGINKNMLKSTIIARNVFLLF